MQKETAPNSGRGGEDRREKLSYSDTPSRRPIQELSNCRSDARTLTRVLGGKWCGHYGQCRCPCHDDKRPSLTIRDGDHALLFKCHAGCDSRAIADKLRDHNLRDGEDRSSNGKTAFKIIASHPYVDENGSTLLVVDRLEPKSFRQR